MATLGFPIFISIILCLTVKIRGDFTIITAVSKLKDMVDKLKDSVDSINVRIDNLEKISNTNNVDSTKKDNVMMETGDVEQTNKRVIKALISEKVFVRKSLSVYEGKFKDFQKQMTEQMNVTNSKLEASHATCERICAKNVANLNSQENYRSICAFPGVPMNSELKPRFDSVHVFQDGDVVKYQCNDGYSISGYIARSCTNGQWTTVRFTCDAIMCPSLDGIQYGSIFQDSSDGLRDNYMSVAEYTCIRGYKIFGKELRHMRTCQADGQWSGHEPYCEAPVCDEISPFYGGRPMFYNDNRREHAVALLRCDNGYSLYPTGIKSIRCKTTSSGELEWTPEPPLCYKKLIVQVPINCQTFASSIVELTHKQSFTLSPKVRHEFYATKNYLTSSSLTITNNNGTFDQPLPQCVPERCKLWSLRNVHVYYPNKTQATGQVDSHTDYTFKCKVNYEFDGHDYRNQEYVVRRCEYGRFENVPPCIEKHCVLTNDELELSQGRRSSLELVEHNSHVYVNCKSDRHELYSKALNNYLKPFSSRCEYGQFDRAVNSLICVPKRCVLTNDQLEISQFRRSSHVAHNSYVDVNCKADRHELYGNVLHENVPFNILCEYGQFHPDVNSLNCVPRLHIPGQHILDHDHRYITSKQASQAGVSKDCAISEISKYTYIDDEAKEIVPPFSVMNGKQISVECKYDSYMYEYYGETLNESITCVNGILDSVSIDCTDSPGPADKTDSCQNFKIKNGTVSRNQIGKYFVFCDMGYTLNIPKVAQDKPCNCSEGELICFAGTKPVCKAEFCELPSNAAIYEDKLQKVFSAGESIFRNRMKCAHGYTLSSVKVMTCQDDGTWTDSIRCHRVNNTCAFPDVPLNSELTQSVKSDHVFQDGDVVKYQCNDGYSISGDITIRCTDGQWTNVGFFCDKKCDTTLLAHTKVFNADETRVKGLVESGISYKVTCETVNYVFEEYPDLGYIESRCEDGSFQHVSSCIERPCTLFNTDENLQFRNDTQADHIPIPDGYIVQHDTKVFVSCKSDYELYNTRADIFLGKKETTITCDYGNIGEIPKCAEPTNFKYLVRLQVGDQYGDAGIYNNVYVRIDGHGEQTKTTKLNGYFGRKKLIENEIQGIDVRPIQTVVVSKDKSVIFDDHLLILYVSILIEESDDYYVFTKDEQPVWLTASKPVELSISRHPERCIHTYGEAMNRSPKPGNRGKAIGLMSLRECKQRCATTRSLSCKSIHFMPSATDSHGMGHCYHYTHSPDSDYFRNNTRKQTRRQYVSYKRICREP